MTYEENTKTSKSAKSVDDFLGEYDTDDMLIRVGREYLVSQEELERLLTMAYKAGWDKSEKLVWD